MAMYKLKSEQDRLCEWLSQDSSHIIKQCGDILSLNEFLEIQNQTCAPNKMQTLLKIIIQKGEETCQMFVDILRKNQEHYHQLQQFFNPTQCAESPTVAADSGSVVTTRRITGTKGKSLNITTDVSGSGSSQPGNIAGQVEQAHYIASGNSVICADNICNASIDGDINLSVTVNTSQVHSGRVNESLPSSQEPAVKMIRKHKDKLIACLMADCTFILNCVHTRDIITDREYQNLKDISQSEKTVINLLDLVMCKGQQSCTCLLEVLRESEVLKTYPQLRDIIKKTL